MDALFQINSVRLQNFRCFARLEAKLDPRVTVVFAENGGGKTAFLEGLSVALGAAFNPATRSIDETRDVRETPAEPSPVLSPHYPCSVQVLGSVGGHETKWERRVTHVSARTDNAGSKLMRAHLARIQRDPESDWPVFAYYGTQRLWSVARKTSKKRPEPSRRADGYVDALDPRSNEKQLLDWLWQQTIGSLQDGADPTFDAVLGALRTAADHPTADGPITVSNIVFEAKRAEPVVHLANGERIPWSRLSDGYHIYLGLVADLARRCATLNPHRGADAVTHAQGIVLIDEVDLHLHPQWQRLAVPGLLRAFSRLQFVVSTHSPQVLSSVENAQVTRLSPAGAVERLPVAGRDSNAVLRDAMDTSDRAGNERPEPALLRKLYTAIEERRWVEAEDALTQLRTQWPETDPEIVRATAFLDWHRDAPNQ